MSTIKVDKTPESRQPEPPEQTPEAEPVVKHVKENKAPSAGWETKRTETWISLRFAEHMVTVHGLNGPELVKFKDYKYICDLLSERGRAIAGGLRTCGRFHIDLCVVGEPYAEDDISGRAEMLKRLRDMSVGQLRAMITIDELVQCGIAPASVEPNELIAAILKTKSLR